MSKLTRFVRVNYFPGQLLSVDDLRAEQEYVREKSKQHNRMLHGAGLVSGLKVAIVGGEVRVSPGLALDCEGNEIVVDSVQDFALPAGDSRSRYLVLRYAEVESEFVSAGEGTQPSRVEESFELSYASADPGLHHPRRGKLCAACGAAHAVKLAKLVLRAGRWHVARPARGAK
jgi:hypothetical protein